MSFPPSLQNTYNHREVLVLPPKDRLIHRYIPLTELIERDLYTTEVVEKPVGIEIDFFSEQLVQGDTTYSPRYEHVRVEKPIPYIVENPIIHETYMEVDSRDLHHYTCTPNYELLPTSTRVTESKEYIDRPVIKQVTKDVIKEIPIERLIEREFEVKRYIPVEHVTENPVEVIREVETEVPVYKEIIEEKAVPVEKFVPRVREVIKRVPIPVEKIIEERIEVPKYVEKLEDIIIENPLFRINETTKHEPIPTERKHIIRVPNFRQKIEKLTSASRGTLEFIREKPHTWDKVEERIVNYEIIREMPVPQIVNVDIEVPVFNTTATEKELRRQVPCKRIVDEGEEIIMQKIVPVRRIVEKPVIIEEPEEFVTVQQEKIVYFDEYKIVPKYVEKIRDYPIEADRKTNIEEPMMVPRIESVLREIPESKTIIVKEGEKVVEDLEILDPELNKRIKSNIELKSQFDAQNIELEAEIALLKANELDVDKLNATVLANARLSSEVSELGSRKNAVERDIERLKEKVRGLSDIEIRSKVPHKDVNKIREAMEQAIRENQKLLDMVEALY